MQLAAYCLLLEETYGAPPYGILRYADRQFAVDYTPALREALLNTLQAMRAALATAHAERSHHEPARCFRCGYRDLCDQALA